MTTPQPITKVRFVSVFKELFNEAWRTIVFYGGRGSGKSTAVAEALLIRGRQKKHLILCTRELQNTIADSVHALLSRIISDRGYTDYEITDKEIRNTNTGTKFIFKGLKHNATEIKSTEGITICWVEEAQSISEDSLKVLVPTVREPGSQIIYTFNRKTELDPVYVRYVVNKRPRSFIKKVNYDVLDKLGLFPEELRLEMEEDKKDPELYAHVWLGEPEGQADDAIISRTATLAAMQRTVEGEGGIEVGVDVARKGKDRTVFAMRKGLKYLRHEVFEKLKTPKICDKLEVFVDYDKTIPIKVDDTGVGGGVTDEMEKRGYNVIGIDFNQNANDSNKYSNWISEGWFHFASVMDEAELPLDDELLMELTTRLWDPDEKSRRRVESKKLYKKRGFRSPDLADAFILCYSVTPVDGFLAWAKERTSQLNTDSTT